jgi:hypothetical protein
MLGKPTLPKKVVKKLGGFKIMVRCTGTYQHFVWTAAQAGDPKGSVTITGPKLKVSVGSWLFPVNLEREGDLVDRLGEQLKTKYRREPEWKLLRRLVNLALQEYGAKAIDNT